jgi:anaerobic magnesium-protoporphyrin IX monomethyl ester cyclase
VGEWVRERTEEHGPAEEPLSRGTKNRGAVDDCDTVVMTGHAGSTPAHPVCVRMMEEIKRVAPRAITVYGGVFPTYHAREILERESVVDVVVRGEGEATAVELMHEVAMGGELSRVRGIAYRDETGRVTVTEAAAPIADLDRFRVGWELIEDWDLYQCFGLGRAAIVQFSRGCPHRCTYCGQHGFWVKWRRRDPERVADEVARLHREFGLRFITLADENPTTDKREWRRLLEAIVSRRVGVHFFATIRASDIVRDEEMLGLYRRAGMLYVLLGVDATDPAVLERVRKRSTTSVDLKACRLLRQHGIRSIVAQIVGLGEDSWGTFARARRALEEYDGDLLNVMYATRIRGRPLRGRPRGGWWCRRTSGAGTTGTRCWGRSGCGRGSCSAR